jgi:hypothetical protein
MAKAKPIVKKIKTRRTWSLADDRLLKSLAGKEPLAKIAAALKRTPAAVRVRATMSSISLSTRPKKLAKATKKGS